MPAFDVTVVPTSLDAKPGESKTIVATATNRLKQPVTARAFAVVNPPAAASWVTAPPNARQVFSEPGATRDFQFRVTVPADAAAGAYTLRVDVVDVERQDDNFGQSAAIGLRVTVPPPVTVDDTGGVKWWVWVVAAVVVLGVGFGVWKIFFSADKMPDLVKKPYAEAVAELDPATFAITRVDTLHSDTIGFARGVVISQSIAPDTKLTAEANPLQLVVQQSFAVVPELAGLTGDVAGNRLGLDSLLMVVGFTLKHSLVPPPDQGKVVRTVPAAGTLVVRGLPVTVLLRRWVRCVGFNCIRDERVIRTDSISNRLQLKEWKRPVP